MEVSLWKLCVIYLPQRGQTPLITAAWWINADAVKVLSERGADLNTQDNVRGMKFDLKAHKNSTSYLYYMYKMYTLCHICTCCWVGVLWLMNIIREETTTAQRKV